MADTIVQVGEVEPHDVAQVQEPDVRIYSHEVTLYPCGKRSRCSEEGRWCWEWERPSSGDRYCLCDVVARDARSGRERQLVPAADEEILLHCPGARRHVATYDWAGAGARDRGTGKRWKLAHVLEVIAKVIGRGAIGSGG